MSAQGNGFIQVFFGETRAKPRRCKGVRGDSDSVGIINGPRFRGDRARDELDNFLNNGEASS